MTVAALLPQTRRERDPPVSTHAPIAQLAGVISDIDASETAICINVLYIDPSSPTP